MHQPTVLLFSSSAIERRDLCSGLLRFGYETITASTPAEAHTALSATRRANVIIVDATAEGLAFAREAVSARPGVRVIYMAATPHRLLERDRVPDAPIIRSPCATHQLVGIIAGFGRRTTADQDAA